MPAGIFVRPAENPAAVYCSEARSALQEAAKRYPGENLLVVTHEGVVKSLIYHLCGRKFLPGEPPILESYQLHWLVWQDERLQVEELNAIELEA